jgi:hypothetical protein
MNTPRVLLASFLTLCVAGLVLAADSKPIARVISIQEIETADASGYASLLAKYNESVKAKFGIDTYLHVYVSRFDGEKSSSVRSVAVADSVATLTKVAAFAETDPTITGLRDHLQAIRKVGARTLYQCVRLDGAVKNSYVYTTLATVTDEAGYLKSLDGLRALLDKNSMTDVKINVYRVLAGRTNFTHRIMLAAPTNERLATLLDFIGTDASSAEWIASAAKYRTVVSNFTAHDIIN